MNISLTESLPKAEVDLIKSWAEGLVKLCSATPRYKRPCVKRPKSSIGVRRAEMLNRRMAKLQPERVKTSPLKVRLYDRLNMGDAHFRRIDTFVTGIHCIRIA